MATLHITATGNARTELASAYHAALGRMGLTRSSPRRSALEAVGVALGGAETSAEIDLSALTRRDLSSLIRSLDGIAQIVPNPGTLISFARSVEAADRAANPTACALRDA